MDLLEADRLTDDEASDQVALGADERGHLRPDPHPRRHHRGRMLDLATDAEQMGVVASQPDDVALAGPRHRDQEVAVRDAAGERGQGQVDVGQLGDLLHCQNELVTEITTNGFGTGGHLVWLS